jgi:hypothetical protein
LPTTSSADLLLNNVQVDFATAIQIFGTTSAEVSRIGHMFGRNYQNNYATEFNEAWRVSYTGVLNNIKLMNDCYTKGLENIWGKQVPTQL